MSEELLQFARAIDFAARKHTHQRRKGELEEPYINHLADVTRLLAAATEGNDVVLVLGGMLHDTLEDTETTFDELEAEFGHEVASLVAEVTDDTSLKKSERRRLQVEKTPFKSDRAKMIKLADKTSNLHSIIHSPPKDWSDERKTEYLEWAHEVVSGCRGVSTFLEDEFDRAYTEGLKAMPVRTDRFMYEAGDLQPANTPEEIKRLEDERKEFDKWMASTLKKQDE